MAADASSISRDHNRFSTSTQNESTARMSPTRSSRWAEAYTDVRHITDTYYDEELGNFNCPRGFTYMEKLKSWIGVDVVKNKVNSWYEDLGSLVDKLIPPSHIQYLTASELLETYWKTKEVEPLLRLYTLETPFYNNLNEDDEKTKRFFAPIYFHLPDLFYRAFEGKCYRGLTMNVKDLEAYHWALEKREHHLGTTTFWSTSLDKNVAQMFSGADAKPNVGQVRVLMHFDFTYKCPTALCLFAQPRLSNFPDEEEVLVLPGTFFHVTKVEKHNDGIFYEIFLQLYDARKDINDTRDFVMQNRLDDYLDGWQD